jgi:hypothetical protein
MRTRLILTCLTAAATTLLLWMVWVVVGAYLMAPSLVAALDRAGVLSFWPSELPCSRLCALLVVQDRTFYRHQGIGLADGPLGHTTITQSVGKGFFFDGFDPGLLRHRKIRLMLASLGFDWRIPKDTQLRLFLNRAYFGTMNGRELIGFPAAASAFYGKTVAQLSDPEYLSLLAMLEAPNRYHPLRQPKVNADRVARIQEQVRHSCREGCFEGSAPVPCKAEIERR